MAPIKIVPINDHSDGDPSNRPSNPEWTIINPPTLYLEKLAKGWLEAQGQPTYGSKYSDPSPCREESLLNSGLTRWRLHDESQPVLTI